MLDYKLKQLQKYFNIDNPFRENQISCPYHDDIHPSASLNLAKGLFNCFVCGGKTTNQLFNDVLGNGMKKNEFKLDLGLDKELFPKPELPKFSRQELLEKLKALIEEKKLTKEILERLQATPILDEASLLFGYLGFPILNNKATLPKYTARKFIPELAGPKWQNSNGEKPLYMLDTSGPDILLVEGIFDLTGLMTLGYHNVVCNLGTELNQKRVYPLKEKIVYILFDNDYAGFTGSEKAYEALRKVKAYPIILELPQEFGKDVNEALNNKDFPGWLRNNLTQIESDDVSYLEFKFNSDDNLNVYSTGLKTLDQYLGGGYKDGVHVIAGEPGVGKSAYLLWLSAQMILHNHKVKVLYITYEISKRQCWARITSIFDEQNTWSEIEAGKEPTEEAKEKTKLIARRLKIMAGIDISEVVRAMRNYDVLIIDYIQRMPGDTDSEKFNISKNIRLMSNMARDKGKIILVASSTSRAGYGKEELNIFKESGDIEFVVQSAMKLVNMNHAGIGRMLKFVLLKNTRGQERGELWVEGDMAHNMFQEITPGDD